MSVLIQHASSWVNASLSRSPEGRPQSGAPLEGAGGSCSSEPCGSAAASASGGGMMDGLSSLSSNTPGLCGSLFEARLAMSSASALSPRRMCCSSRPRKRFSGRGGAAWHRGAALGPPGRARRARLRLPARSRRLLRPLPRGAPRHPRCRLDLPALQEYRHGTASSLSFR